MQLTYASGTCAQSWTFNPGRSLPYRLERVGGNSSSQWRFTERVQGVTASNNLQYGERVLRQAHAYPNPSVSCNEGSLSGTAHCTLYPMHCTNVSPSPVLHTAHYTLCTVLM
jgi:hypothetical protein